MTVMCVCVCVCDCPWALIGTRQKCVASRGRASTEADAATFRSTETGQHLCIEQKKYRQKAKFTANGASATKPF